MIAEEQEDADYEGPPKELKMFRDLGVQVIKCGTHHCFVKCGDQHYLWGSDSHNESLGMNGNDIEYEPFNITSYVREELKLKEDEEIKDVFLGNENTTIMIGSVET